jgi:hypothetical protein
MTIFLALSRMFSVLSLFASNFKTASAIDFGSFTAQKYHVSPSLRKSTIHQTGVATTGKRNAIASTKEFQNHSCKEGRQKKSDKER